MHLNSDFLNCSFLFLLIFLTVTDVGKRCVNMT